VQHDEVLSYTNALTYAHYLVLLDERQFHRGDTGLAAALYALRSLRRHVTLEF
jgi:hypothetical protein